MNGNHHICQNTCCQHDLDRLTMRDIADLLDNGQLSVKQAEKSFAESTTATKAGTC